MVTLAESNWQLSWETTQHKRIEEVWERTSLIPTFVSPSLEGVQFLIYASSSSQIAPAKYLFAGWVAKLVTSNVGDFLLNPQKLWMKRTVLCEFVSAEFAPLWFQPASRLNDLSISIWRII